MRKNIRKTINEILSLILEEHDKLYKNLINGDSKSVLEGLEICQNGAINIGNLIEESEGEGGFTVKLLEDYCEAVYQIYCGIQQGNIENNVSRRLPKLLSEIEDSVNNIKEHKEVVFLPYKASMWDSLESVWKAADEDECCNVYVIPIPYFDKDSLGNLVEMHYEGEEYPEYVPITWYEDYDFEVRQPDIIFIHNPYDGCNQVTSVHPFFYAKNLKQFTEKLVYIPYFVLNEIEPTNKYAIKGMEHFVTTPGVIHAHKVIVQSEKMRQIYVDVLSEFAGEDTRKYWEKKILGLGSPKFDKVANMTKENCEIPEKWMKLIINADGSSKKVILYNTSLSALLEHREKVLNKIQVVLDIFREVQSEVVLLWRPHPLFSETIESMRPELLLDYLAIVEQYKAEGWGIYDDTSDLNRAITISDAYYGDPSSLVQLCRRKGMPVMLQNVECI